MRRRKHLDHRVRAGHLTLVLLHGIGTGPGAWRPQLEAMAGQDVSAPDLVPAYRNGFEAAVGEAGRLVPAGAVVCGLSLGGLVALRLAERVELGRLIVCAGFERLPARLRRRTRAFALAARAAPRGFLHRQLVAEIPRTIAPRRSRKSSRFVRPSYRASCGRPQVASSTRARSRSRSSSPAASMTARTCRSPARSPNGYRTQSSSSSRAPDTSRTSTTPRRSRISSLPTQYPPLVARHVPSSSV